MKKKIFIVLLLVFGMFAFQRQSFAVIEISDRHNVPLNKSWNILFSRDFSMEEVEKVTIEKEEKLLLVEVTMITKNKLKVSPLEKYQPNSKYTLNITLRNAKKYRMNFFTEGEATIRIDKIQYRKKFKNIVVSLSQEIASFDASKIHVYTEDGKKISIKSVQNAALSTDKLLLKSDYLFEVGKTYSVEFEEKAIQLKDGSYNLQKIHALFGISLLEIDGIEYSGKHIEVYLSDYILSVDPQRIHIYAESGEEVPIFEVNIDSSYSDVLHLSSNYNFEASSRYRLEMEPNAVQLKSGIYNNEILNGILVIPSVEIVRAEFDKINHVFEIYMSEELSLFDAGKIVLYSENLEEITIETMKIKENDPSCLQLVLNPMNKLEPGTLLIMTEGAIQLKNGHYNNTVLLFAFIGD